MSSLKPGDIVRVIDAGPYKNMANGDVGIVERATRDMLYSGHPEPGVLVLFPTKPEQVFCYARRFEVVGHAEGFDD